VNKGPLIPGKNWSWMGERDNEQVLGLVRPVERGAALAMYVLNECRCNSARVQREAIPSRADRKERADEGSRLSDAPGSASAATRRLVRPLDREVDRLWTANFRPARVYPKPWHDVCMASSWNL